MRDVLNLIPHPIRAIHPVDTSPPSQPSNVFPLQQAQIDWNSVFTVQQANSSRIQNGNSPIQLSVENQRNNSSWGDPMDAKPESVTRIYALNVNGLTMDRRGGQFDELCKVSKEVQADMVACQEHCLDTTQVIVRSIMYDTIRKSWPRSRLTLGTTPTPFVNMYKPGGTMLFSVDHIAGRVLLSSSDKWGRWTSQTLRCQHDRKLTAVSVYQVNPDNKKKWVVTAAIQQRSLLLESQDPISDPRAAFVRDFQQFLQERISAGDDLLLMGDFNEAVGRDQSPLTSLFSELGLVDLMALRHQGPMPPTYARGRKCLDYGFSTPRVALALKACGYEAFNARFPTDHRSYYFDFYTKLLFGTATPSLASPSQRILNWKNVKQVTAYIKFVYDYLQECNAFDRANQFSHPGNRHAHPERLDRDMLRASLTAEKKIQQRVGEAAWSVALDQSRKKVTILRKCLSMIRTGLALRSIIAESSQQLQVPLDIPETKQQCCTMLNKAKREVEDIVSTSFQRRDQEIRERIMTLESSNRTRRGVTSIEIPLYPDEDPKTCTEWRLIDVPSEIVEHIQTRKQEHFGQAHGSPFTISPLADDLGFCGDDPGASNILQGHYDHTPFSDSVKLLLQHLQITQDLCKEQSFPTITEGEFIGKLKVWKESTATSPSGLHLGHYKALIARHEYSNDNEDHNQLDLDDATPSKKDEWDHMQRSIRQFQVNLINYALERGYSYRRWQTVANTILFKDPDSLKLHRTGLIHIYEADSNLVLGLLKWRMMLYQSEALKMLNNGQYGSRPKRNAIDLVMSEELQFEISQLSRPACSFKLITT